MDPFSKAIEAAERLIGHSLHPAIVTVPIGAWTVSNVCDGLAWLTGDRRQDDAARISMAVGLIGAVGAAATGLHDYGKIPPSRPSHEVATQHGLGNSVVATLFVASYILRQADHSAGRRTRPLARVLGLAGGGLALYTAWLGGKLVQEYGESVQPVVGWPEQEARDGEASRSLTGARQILPD